MIRMRDAPSASSCAITSPASMVLPRPTSSARLANAPSTGSGICTVAAGGRATGWRRGDFLLPGSCWPAAPRDATSSN